MRIGVDIGGTNVVTGLVKDGRILDRISFKAQEARRENTIVENIIKNIKELCNKNSITPEQVESIGIGVPGAVNYIEGTVIECVNLGMKNVQLRNELRKELGDVKVLVENDANAATLCEHLFGTMKGTRNSMLVTIGTGVGGGFILNGELFSGKSGRVAEIGHITVGEGFYECGCGQRGCLETFASATAIVKYAEKLIKDGESSLLEARLAKGSIETKDVFDCAKEGDEVCLRAIKRFIKYLSIGIANFINVLDLELVAIGGGVCNGHELFFDDLVEEINKRTLFKASGNCKVCIAELKNDAGIIGAAMIN
ncbi:ROK family protein [Oceanirhabdus sp. W0125-5]|uniref:ROK family protein n=1 Tax=Oceanirhabdus sp. W0125-5 TaxID=2999116 RepID=UPI0022F30EA4|nr:ROK family protein [Oceanirhabdus sp. W0125-5]WBW95717.1 ROK family protein [Oceanirhabdus sp. W0125-5]